MHRHAPVCGSEILFTRSCTTVRFEVQNMNFQAPKRKTIRFEVQNMNFQAPKRKTVRFEVQNGKKAPPLESSPADLSFGGGRVAIGESMCLHTPISPLQSMVHAPITTTSFEALIGGFPSSNSRNRQHFWIPHQLIYCLAVEPFPSEASCSSTRR